MYTCKTTLKFFTQFKMNLLSSFQNKKDNLNQFLLLESLDNSEVEGQPSENQGKLDIWCVHIHVQYIT